MTDERLILAVDIGTSSTRAIVFDAQAQPQFVVKHAYPTTYPQPDRSEQDAETVFQAAVACLKEAAARLPVISRLAAVVLSAQMYSILAVDGSGTPLTPSLTWGDTRSASQAAAIRQIASPTLAARTGCPTQAIYPLSKIRWLRTEGGLPSGARCVSIKDYVVFRLTGQWVADWSSASASGLLDITRRRWDEEALSLAGVKAADLAELASPRHIMRRWRREVIAAAGLPDDLPLILGAGDAPLANIGVGAVDPGAVAVNIGTSAAARVLTAQPEVDAQARLWTYIADVDHWVTGGIIGSGGSVYDWLVQEILGPTGGLPADRFAEAERLAAQTPPGADDLLFIPYFTGVQSPDWNPKARGLLYGLTLRHQPGHIVRAAIEGLSFALLRVARLIQAVHSAPLQMVYITGGLSQSSVAVQTLADIFTLPVVTPSFAESSARGAAILGWLALGAADGYAAFAQAQPAVSADARQRAVYARQYEAFCSLHRKLHTPDDP
jgi:gluconokinase